MRDPHIGVAADLARADVSRHIRLKAAELEDRLGWNTWEARRARHHARLERTRDMLHQAHESAMMHLGGDLPHAPIELGPFPVKVDPTLPPDTFELRDGTGRVLTRVTGFTLEPVGDVAPGGAVTRDSRGRFMRAVK